MVCIAAFILLALLSLSLPVLRVFNKSAADTIWHSLTAAWQCVGRRVTFRACVTSFKEDIEHSILRRVVRKNPKFVKPAKIAIEVVSALIIIVTIWSLLVVVKSGLSLYVYGTCNVSQPSACSLDQTQACSIDSVSEDGPVRTWFNEWGDLFAALPARMRAWNASEFIPQGGMSYIAAFGDEKSEDLPVAIDIFDPGCIICKQSFENQLSSGFIENRRVYVIPYSIKAVDGYKFKNSRLTAQYIEAVRGRSRTINEWVIIKNLFTTKYKTPAGDMMDYQQAFNLLFTAEQAELAIQGWLRAAGADDATIRAIAERAHSDEITARIDENHRLVDNDIRTKHIPTMIYDGKRHDGLFEK